MTKAIQLRTALLTGAALVTLAGPALAQTVDPTDRATFLDEVVVTANKRAENVRDVSGSISAVTSQQLEAIGAQSLGDYIQRTPGVVFNSYQPGVSHVVLRGIATSSGNVQGQGTTGYYLNDIPLAEPGFTIVIPDIDTFDLQRVEVLRGPQGSLFGAASMGGAINYIAAVADPDAFDAAIEVTGSQTKNADLSFATKAMINAPLTDNFAVRLTGFHRQDKGYLDNIGIGKDGSNEVSQSGGRFSAVWTPNDNTTVTWLSMFQETDAADNSYQQPAVGDLKRNTAVPEYTDTSVEIHSLRLDHDFGFANFTALGSFQKKAQDWQFDYTPIRVFYNADLGINLTNPLFIESGGSSEGKSLEMRLASPSGNRFEWVVGGLYFETDKFLYEQIGAMGAREAFNNSTLPFYAGGGNIIAPEGDIFNAFMTTVDGAEKALFGEASYHLTPEWKLTAGGRLFKTEISTRTTQVGFSTYPGAPVITGATTEDDGFSPKVALTYTPSNDLMVYGLVSQGFRFGTPNVPGITADPIPAGSTSDELTNYELGVRTNWLNRTLQVDATLFYVDWKDIQLRLPTTDGFNYAANGGSAESKGVELFVAWAPTSQLDLTSSVTYTDAQLTEPYFILFYGTAPDGAQLPGSAEWSVSNTLAYRFETQYDPTLVLTHSYLSEGYSDINSTIPGVVPNLQGDYNLFDARLSAHFGQTRVTVFGSNLGDERGVTRSVSETNGLGQGIVRPRTFGVTLNWSL